MPDRDMVLLDVHDCMKKVIEDSTDMTYDDRLIPKKKPDDGWEAKPANWDQILAAIQECLQKKPDYKDLDLDSDMGRGTIGEPLSHTRTIIVAKIMEKIMA